MNNQQLGIEGIKAIATALQSGRCPQGLQLELENNQLGVEEAKAIATALESGHCPQDLQLFLEDNQLGIEGVNALALALQSGRCPQGLTLCLTDYQLGVEGAKAIATALQSGKCPQGLTLYLNNNLFGTEGAKAIADALESGHCPSKMLLLLERNQFKVEGAKAIATALQSGYCPPYLGLNLYDNQLGVEGARAIADALQSGYCPQALDLLLQNNEFNDGVMFFPLAIKSGRCPQGLGLQLGYERVPEVAKAFEEAWKVYYAYQQEYFLKCIAFQQGQGQVDSPIIMLPQDILNKIYRYLLPTTPILAKKTQISAKIFRQRHALPMFSGKSIEASRLDHSLENALLAKTFTEKVAKIKESVNNFLQKELEMLGREKFVKSPTVALLCKYHLLINSSSIYASNNAPEEANMILNELEKAHSPANHGHVEDNTTPRACPSCTII